MAALLYQVLIALALMVGALMVSACLIGVCQMVLSSRASRREEQERLED